MRVVREALNEIESSLYPTIYGRLQTGKHYTIRLEEKELLIYLGFECELSALEIRELERVCIILEGI